MVSPHQAEQAIERDAGPHQLANVAELLPEAEVDVSERDCFPFLTLCIQDGDFEILRKHSHPFWPNPEV
jgi:hypothetical protein